MESKDVAVFSDIHGNLHALQAVLADMEARGIREHLCLGDIVGYGAQPAECVDLVRQLRCPVLMGNHDFMVATGQGTEDLSERTRPGIEWSRQQVTVEQKTWLASLPFTIEADDYEAVHSSLRQPETWRYVLTTDEAALHFQKQRKPVCFIGHSHIPRIWVEGAERPIEPLGSEDMRNGKRHIVNVGSVGQPRDREPEACYVIYSREHRAFRFQRVAYDVAGAQRAVIAAGLPAYYAQRLELGR